MSTTLERELPLAAIHDFCKRYPIRELALFGSALREDFRVDSDIDLLVEFELHAPVGMLTLARMQRELCQLLQRRVDLVPKAGLKPLIRDEVLRTAHVLYSH